MAIDGPDPEDMGTEESGAGAPARGAAETPTEAELDARERQKARPRRAAGPELGGGDAGPSLEAAEQAPPPSTDPEGGQEGGDAGGAPAPSGESGANGEAGEGHAGRPADHVEAKPSGDELDRRDRRGAAPRRAAGPPLGDEPGEDALREAQMHVPPPETDPDM